MGRAFKRTPSGSATAFYPNEWGIWKHDGNAVQDLLLWGVLKDSEIWLNKGYDGVALSEQ